MKVLRNIFSVFLGVVLGIALLMGLFYLGKVVFKPASVDCLPTPVVVNQPPVVVEQPVAPAVVAPAYVCNAVAIGTPVQTGGSCSFCTVNYTKPGQVFIAGETAIEYEAGAYVFQYNTGNVEGFNLCIQGQSFFTDPQYQPVWK